MNLVIPDAPGLSGAFLQAHRRRPGSPVSGDNIEAVYTVIVKRAYSVAPAANPADGSLSPRAGGPEVYETDRPENLLQNADFANGQDHWSLTGGIDATFGDGEAVLTRDGADGDLRQTAGFGRQLRDRRIGIAAKAAAAEALAFPRPSIVASAQTVARADAGSFGEKPAVLAAADRSGAGVTASSLDARFPALAADDEPLTLSELSVIVTEYESDLVPYKPGLDLIVIADAPPLPLTVSVNGTVRFSQAALAPQDLTGLGWEDKVDTPREAEAGDVMSTIETLPGDFENSFFNGYRRSRLQGAATPFLSPGDLVVVTRDSGDPYGFTLPAEHPVLRHKWFTGTGKDDPCLWRGRDVPLLLDTLVIEPDRNHAYAVWRACWAIDDALGGAGPIAPDMNRAAEVTLEGGP